ncbi:MAG: hypothetical protein AB3N11_16245 [Arenibacterium sp.]
MRFILALLLLFPLAALAQTTENQDTVPKEEASEPAMTLQRLVAITSALDADATVQGNMVQLTIADVPVLVVADPRADRMRAMVPIRAADGLEPAELMRLMQANFDTALDARYAVAQGRLWGVFIHPLSPLKKDQLLSGLAQTVGVALTYGSSYSGGAVHYGGGDSPRIYKELLDDLRKKGEEI